ncbi:MAG: Ig-like domain-containing protein [Nanoarchaeota archaeon]
MKRIILPLLTLLIVVAGTMADTVITRSPRPEITASFEESVEVVSTNLTSRAGEFGVALVSANANHTIFRFIPSEDLDEGNYTFTITARDEAGNTGVTRQGILVNFSFLLSLLEPPEGIASSQVFNITLNSSVPASCRYDYSQDQPFEEYRYRFNITGDSTHKILGYDYGRGNSFFVICNTTFGRITAAQRFAFGLDSSAPVILRLFAVPNPVTQYVNISGVWKLLSTMTVETDEETVCRYNNDTEVPFAEMAHEFNGSYQTRHEAVLDFGNQQRTYAFHVACKNRAQLISSTLPLQIVVNTSLPLSVAFVEFGDTRNTSVRLEAVTNKNAFCSFRNGSDSIIASSPYGIYHTHQVTGLRSGSHTFGINCSRNDERAEDSLTFTVDLTAPVVRVNDTSDDPDNPEKTWRNYSLRVKWDALDNETEISRISYRLEASGGAVVVDWTSSERNGEWIWVDRDHHGHSLNLTNGQTYYFRANATNTVGLMGSGMSNGITIDTSITPPSHPTCTDGRHNNNESDTDCGGPCPGCGIGKDCHTNDDCLSGYCSENDTCAWPHCENNETDEDETDEDCGGDDCDPCENGDNCFEDEDCESGYCDQDDDECAEPACDDGVMNQDETDQDCGGSCDGCGLGEDCDGNDDCESGFCNGQDVCAESSCDDDEQGPGETGIDCGGEACEPCEDGGSCQVHGDCQSRNCVQGVCVSSQDNVDSDHDGMPDWWEIQYGLDPNRDDAQEDPDTDTLSNIVEYQKGYDPHKKDTDGDGIPDNIEAGGGEPEKPSAWSIIILILLIVLVAGAIGYYVYTKYVKKPKRPAYRPQSFVSPPPASQRPSPVGPRQAAPAPQPVNLRQRFQNVIEKRAKMFDAFDRRVERKEGYVPLRPEKRTRPIRNLKKRLDRGSPQAKQRKRATGSR